MSLVSLQHLNRFLTINNWEKHTHDGGVLQFIKDDDCLFLTQKTTSPKYLRLIDDAVYLLAKNSNATKEDMSKRIIESTANLIVIANANNSKHSISFDGSFKLRLAIKDIISDILNSVENVGKIAKKNFLEECVEELPQPSSYKCLFYIPEKVENLSGEKILTTMKEAFININELYESNLIPTKEELEKDFSLVNLKFLNALTALKDVSDVSNEIKIKVRTNFHSSNFFDTSLKYNDDILEFYKKLRKSLKQHIAEDTEIIVRLAGIKHKSIKNYHGIALGDTILNGVLKEVTIHLKRDQYLEVLDNYTNNEKNTQLPFKPLELKVLGKVTELRKVVSISDIKSIHIT
jgi:hypothetical protein